MIFDLLRQIINKTMIYEYFEDDELDFSLEAHKELALKASVYL